MIYAHLVGGPRCGDVVSMPDFAPDYRCPSRSDRSIAHRYKYHAVTGHVFYRYVGTERLVEPKFWHKLPKDATP